MNPLFCPVAYYTRMMIDKAFEMGRWAELKGQVVLEMMACIGEARTRAELEKTVCGFDWADALDCAEYVLEIENEKGFAE